MADESKGVEVVPDAVGLRYTLVDRGRSYTIRGTRLALWEVYTRCGHPDNWQEGWQVPTLYVGYGPLKLEVAYGRELGELVRPERGVPCLEPSYYRHQAVALEATAISRLRDWLIDGHRRHHPIVILEYVRLGDAIWASVSTRDGDGCRGLARNAIANCYGLNRTSPSIEPAAYWFGTWLWRAACRVLAKAACLETMAEVAWRVMDGQASGEEIQHLGEIGEAIVRSDPPNPEEEPCEV